MALVILGLTIVDTGMQNVAMTVDVVCLLQSLIIDNSDSNQKTESKSINATL